MLERPFVIFSLPRCGSTTLMRALNCYPDVNCLVEPFNPHRREPQFTFPVTDSAGLRSALDAIFEVHNGIKHVWQPAGFPFPEGSSLQLELLVECGLQVVFLTRRNDLQRLVSEKISAETGVWGVFNPSERDKVHHHDYRPVQVAGLRHRLRADVEAVATFRSALHSRGVRHTEVVYEDLYGTDVARDDRVAAIDRIYRFLGGAEPFEAALHAGVVDLLDHDAGKLNSESSYRQIPGIDLVDRHLGSDSTGWLFDRPGERGDVRDAAVPT